MPTGAETLRQSLTYFLSLTSLIQHLAPDPSNSTLVDVFLESLDTAGLASFLYSVLAASTGSAVSQSGAKHSNDHRTSLTTVRLHHIMSYIFVFNVLQTLASLLIISSVINFQPNRNMAMWSRYGILDIVKHLSRIDQLLVRPSGRQSPPLSLQKQFELLTLKESSLWLSLQDQFSSVGDSPRLMNISLIICWASCRLGCSLLALAENDEMTVEFKSSVSPSSTILLPSLADKLMDAAENPSDVTEESAQEALQQLRCLLLQSSADGANEISAFELHDSDLIRALCEYLFGGCVQPAPMKTKERSLMKSLAPVFERRLLLFIKELCGQSFESLSSASQSWKSTGCLGQPADLRALLLLSRLCVGCMGQLEQLPFRLHTLVAGAPAHSSGTSSSTKHDGGCLPRHLHPDLALQRSVLTIARQQFGSGVQSGDDTNRLVQQLEASVRRQNRRPQIETEEEESGFSLVEGTHHHLQKYVMFKPRALFGHLGRDVKIYARCEIGSVIKCSLSFTLGQSSLGQASLGQSSLGQFSFHDQMSDSDLEKVEKSDIGFFNRLKALKGSSCLLPELSTVTIPDPRVAEDLLTPGAQTRDDNKVTFLLQLSVDIRTTGSLLEQSLRAVIEKQLALVEEKKRNAARRAPKTAKDEQTDGRTDEKSTNEEDDDLASDDSDKSSSSSSSGSGAKHLFISVNGCTVPPHITLCDALCRYSNVLAIDRVACHDAISRMNSRRSNTVTIKPSNTVDRNVVSEGEESEQNEHIENVNESTDLSASEMGVWIVLDKTKRLVISSSAEERYLAVEINDSRNAKQQSSLVTPCPVESEEAGVQTEQDLQTDANTDQPQVVSPLWGVDHQLRIGVGGREPVSQSLSSSLEKYKKLSGMFIREVEVENVEEIFVEEIPSSVSQPFEQKLKDATRSVKLLPLPIGTSTISSELRVLPDGSRLVSIASLLAYFSAKQACQVLGADVARFDSIIEEDSDLFEGRESERSSDVERVKIDDEIMTYPIKLNQRLIDLLEFFDLSAFSSPLVCNSINPKFTHISLYRSLLNDTMAYHYPLEADEITPKPAWMVECVMPLVSLSSGLSTLTVVQQQMGYLRGWNAWLGNDLVMDAGTYPAVMPDTSVFQEKGDDQNDDDSDDNHDDNNNNTDDDDDDDEEEDKNSQDEYVDIPEDETPELIHSLSHRRNHKIEHHRTQEESNQPDVFENSDDFAQVFQIVLVLSQVVQTCIASNNCLATRDPKQFLTDHQTSFLDLLTPHPPLFFPSYSQLRSSLASPVLTVKASRQLSDPIVVASAKLPRWISAIPSIAPLLLPIDVRKTILRSTMGGTFVALVSFKERIREIAEAIGAIHSSSSSGRNLRFSSRPSSPGGDPLLNGGRTLFDSPDDFGDTFDGTKTDPVMLTLAKEILGAEDTNKRKQMERLSDLEQV